LKNDKTTLIDLSILRSLEKKYFVAFVILSKFIHYIENSKDYNKKMIVIPHVDLFFDSHYIDNNYNTANYGKIDKFIEPLLKNGFGLIFTANQIRYLHPHIFNYFQNIISFKATDSRDIAVLKNQMKLQELQGTGYYSSKRNNTYQIDYLMNMRDEEVLVKRSDIPQPFPGSINLSHLKNTAPLTDEQIAEHMDTQGYKLKLSEQRLLEKAKKTIFDKDLGIYSGFIDEIINFLKSIKSIDNVAGLYKSKLKSELLKIINPKASKRVKEKNQIKEIRDELFDILIKHGYLVENHPNRASGNEALRTSYSVGSQYDLSLDDYFKTKQNAPPTVSAEIIEKNEDLDSNILNLFYKQTNKEIIDREIYKSIFKQQTSDFLWEHFEMYSSINRKHFKEALQKGEFMIGYFLNAIHQTYLQKVDVHIPETENPELFFEHLSTLNIFPFDLDDLYSFYHKTQQIITSNEQVEEKAKNLYELISVFNQRLLLFNVDSYRGT
jgi:hypothetical protein